METEKILTLKSLDKQIREKIEEMEDKIKDLGNKIRIIEDSLRR